MGVRKAGVSGNRYTPDKIRNINNIQDYNKASREVASRMQEDRENKKNTFLGSMLLDQTTPVTYYKQKTSENEASIDINRMNVISSNIEKRFEKIDGLHVIFTEIIEQESSGDVESGDLEYKTAGNLKILPKTIKPNQNDIFIFNYFNKLRVYRIDNCVRVDQENDSAYDCEFTEINDDPIIYEENTDDEYKFIAEHIGTNLRTTLLRSDFELLEILRNFDDYISTVYIELFFDKISNSFILKDNCFDFYTGKKIEEKNDLHLIGLYGVDIASSSIFQNIELYDNYMNYFIKKNNLFRYFKEKIIDNDVYYNIKHLDYIRTLFNSIEERNNKSIVYVEPHIIDGSCINNMNFDLRLENKKFILYSQHANPNTFSLINKDIYKYIKNECEINEKIKNEELNHTIYDNITVAIAQTIGMFVNKSMDDDKIIKRLADLENIKEKYINNYYMNPCDIFYTFPIISFMISNLLINKLLYKNILDHNPFT